MCLETLIPFGLLGMIISYFTNPIFFSWYSSFSDIGLHIISGLLLLIFITDNIISSRIVAAIKAEGIKATKDNTEEITQFVKQKLRERSAIRPSGTEPKLKFYIGTSADTLDKANEKLADFEKALQEFAE